MKAAFEDWLNADLDTTDNPYRNNSAAYWAWEGWKAGAAAEREACATINELQRQINELKRADPTQRKPLTEEEIYSMFRTAGSPTAFARAIERTHGVAGEL